MSFIKSIILENLLKETIQPTVYHYTDLSSIIKIISNNKILLSSSLGTIADNRGGAPFFLSTARTSQVNVGYDAGLSKSMRCRLVLDGEKLNQKFKSKPVDFYGRRNGMHPIYNHLHPEDKKYRQQHDFEFEDRIFSFKPYIDNFNQYIKGVEILCTPEYFEKNQDNLQTLKNETSDKNIPFSVYFSKKDFDHKKNSVVDQISSTDNGSVERDYRYNDSHSIDLLFGLLLYNEEFIENYDKLVTFLGYFAEKNNIDSADLNLFKIHEAMRYFMYNNDGLSSLMSELHNVFKGGHDTKLRKYSIFLSKEMKKYKLNKINDLYNLKVYKIKPSYWPKKDYSKNVHFSTDYFYDDEEGNRIMSTQEIPYTTSAKDFSSIGLFITHNGGFVKSDMDYYEELWMADGTLKNFINYLFNRYSEDKAKELLSAAKSYKLHITYS